MSKERAVVKCGFLAAMERIESAADLVLDNGPLHEMSGGEFIDYAAEQVAIATTESTELASARLTALKATVATVKAQGFVGAGSVFVHLYDDSDRELSDIAASIFSIRQALKGLSGQLTAIGKSAPGRPKWSNIGQTTGGSEPQQDSERMSDRHVGYRSAGSAREYLYADEDEDEVPTPVLREKRQPLPAIVDDEDEAPPPPRRAPASEPPARQSRGGGSSRVSRTARARGLLAAASGGLSGAGAGEEAREERRAKRPQSQGALSNPRRMSEDERTDAPEFSSRLWNRIDGEE